MYRFKIKIPMITNGEDADALNLLLLYWYQLNKYCLSLDVFKKCIFNVFIIIVFKYIVNFFINIIVTRTDLLFINY